MCSFDFKTQSNLLYRWLRSRTYTIFEGDTPSPLRTAYRSILALRTAYHHFLASRTAYRFTTKTTVFAVSVYIKKIKLQYVVCTCTVIIENISFDVFAC